MIKAQLDSQVQQGNQENLDLQVSREHLGQLVYVAPQDQFFTLRAPFKISAMVEKDLSINFLGQCLSLSVSQVHRAREDQRVISDYMELKVILDLLDQREIKEGQGLGDRLDQLDSLDLMEE